MLLARHRPKAVSGMSHPSPGQGWGGAYGGGSPAHAAFRAADAMAPTEDSDRSWLGTARPIFVCWTENGHNCVPRCCGARAGMPHRLEQLGRQVVRPSEQKWELNQTPRTIMKY